MAGVIWDIIKILYHSANDGISNYFESVIAKYY